MGDDKINKCKKIFEGYVQIEYAGKSSERFINICRNNEIEIWECARCEDKILFCVSVESFFKLKKIRKKCGGKIRVVRRKGFPFFINKYKYRYFFLVGCILFILVAKVLTMFVWNISFEGNETYSDKELLDFLSRNSIKQGGLMRNVDFNEIEYLIRNGYDNITWVSAERNGTKIIIHIKENNDIYVQEVDDRPCNIISNVDGKIYSIITRSGEPQFKPGDEIKNGDILVSGILRIEDDYGENIKYRFVNADSDIFIMEEEDYYNEIALEDEMTVEEGNIILMDNLNEYIKKKDEKGIQIIENNVTIDFDENKCIASGKLKVLKSVGIKSYISEEDIDRLYSSDIQESEDEN